MKTFSLFLLSVIAALAQTSSPTGITGTVVAGVQSTAATPTGWFVGTGVEANTYSSTYGTALYEPFVHVGACFASGMCEISTVEFGASNATVRQDVAYTLVNNSAVSILALAGGQLTTTTVTNSVLPTSINLGGVGGGFALAVDPGSFLKALKGKGVTMQAELRVSNVSSQGVQPQLAFSLNYHIAKKSK
jgi:hypothetical protein